MKTEMKKKNSKMFLALVVVAALAAVSLAGIAISDNSDAADRVLNQMKEGNQVLIEGTVTDDEYFWIEEGANYGALRFIVPETSKYSGTLSIGTKAAAGEYTTYATLELKNAKSVQITAIAYDTVGGLVTVFMIGDIEIGTPAEGEFKLVQGQVMLGSATVDSSLTLVGGLGGDITSNAEFGMQEISDFLTSAGNSNNCVPFNGKVTAADFSVTSEHTIGAIIAIDDGKAKLAGNAMSPEDMKVADASGDFPQGTLSFEGAAAVEYSSLVRKVMDMGGGFIDPIFETTDINVTVEKGAVITMGGTPSVVVSDADLKMLPGDNLLYAVLIDSKGKTYPGTQNGGNIEFSYVPAGSYTLLLALDDGVDTYVYRGNATVSGSGMSVVANSLLSAAQPLAGAALTLNANDELAYNAVTARFVYAYNLTSEETGTLKSTSGGIGRIEFPSGAFTGEMIFVVMNVSGTVSFYYGDADGVTNLATDVVGVILNNDPIATTKIKRGDATLFVTNAEWRVNAPTPVGADESTILVKGTMNFLYESAVVNGVLDITTGNAYLVFEGDGVVIQGIMPPADGFINTEVPSIAGSSNLAAAYYYKNEGSGSSATSKYYFTSLENAIKSSNIVYLIGDIVILKNTELDNSEFTSIEVILTTGSTLKVGRADNPLTDENEFADPELKIPAKTKLTITDAGSYEVVAGKAIYDVKPTGINVPEADALIEGSGKFIYTDLATALDIATSGEINTLRPATLVKTATVKSGVTLKDTGGAIEIPEDITLTVAGTLDIKNGMLITGTLRINNKATFTNATVVLDGTIEVTSSGTLDIKGGSIAGSTLDDGVMDVLGKVNLTTGATVSVAQLTVIGNLSIGTGTTLTVAEFVRIGEVPSLSTGYTNGATVTGKITLGVNVAGDDAIAWVYGGAFSKNLFTNIVIKTDYKIENNTYLTLWVDAGASEPLPMIYGDEFGADGYMLDVKINGWCTDRLFRSTGMWLPGGDIGDTGWEVVYADWEYKQYAVELKYLQGMTWILDDTFKGGDAIVMINYGQSITVKTQLQPGYEGTPVLKANGNAYSAGTAYKVTGKVTFTATGVSIAGEKKDDGLTLIEILLIIIVIIIGIIALIVAVRLLRS